MLQLGTLAVVGGEPTGPLAGFAVERSWTDDTGRFKIEAKLQFADASEVKLLKSDGRAVTVPLAKLSKPDQAFIDTFLKAEAALKSAGGLPGESADDPFAGGELAGDADAMTGSGKSDPPSRGAPSSPHVGPIPQRKAIVKGTRPLSLAPAREFWSVSPLRPVPEAALQELVLETEIAKPFFAAQRLLAAGTTGHVVLNVYQQGRGNRENFGHFMVVNAITGDSSAVQQEIRTAVEEKIASLQWKLARSATNKMIIQLAPGQPEQAEYYTRTGFGPMPFFAPPPGFGGPRPTGPSEKV